LHGFEISDTFFLVLVVFPSSSLNFVATAIPFLTVRTPELPRPWSLSDFPHREILLTVHGVLVGSRAGLFFFLPSYT